jgi:hypothetical protein
MANGDHKLTRHHVVPSSIALRGENDIVRIPYREHNLYHALFFNYHPEQAIVYLVETFFGGNWDYVRNALYKEWNKQSK